MYIYIHIFLNKLNLFFSFFFFRMYEIRKWKQNENNCVNFLVKYTIVVAIDLIISLKVFYLFFFKLKNYRIQIMKYLLH